MPVLPFAHLALYQFCNLPLFQLFLENPFLIMAFCTILCQSYILLPFLNGFYTPFILYVQGHYYDVLSSDAEIVSAMNKVTAHLETSARHCRSLRNKFLSYSFMWVDDVEESFELFLKGQYAPYERHLLTRPQTVRASARSTHGGRYVHMHCCDKYERLYVVEMLYKVYSHPANVMLSCTAIVSANMCRIML